MPLNAQDKEWMEEIIGRFFGDNRLPSVVEPIARGRVTVTAVNTAIIDHKVGRNQLVKVVAILAGGSDADAKRLKIDDQIYCYINHADNTTEIITFDNFYLFPGQSVKVENLIATSGTQNFSLLGIRLDKLKEPLITKKPPVSARPIKQSHTSNASVRPVLQPLDEDSEE